MEAAEEEAVAVAEGEEAVEMEKDVEVERNCYPMYKPFCNLCTFLTPLMILEELVAAGAVNDFLRMMIPSQPAIYPPLYNLSLSKSSIPSSPFSLFFHSLIYVPTNHSLIPLPSFQPNKQDKTKQKKPPQNLPIPFYSYPRTSCAFFPQLPISTPTPSHFISHPFPTLEDLKSQPPTFSPVQKNFSPAGHGYARIVLVVGEH